MKHSHFTRTNNSREKNVALESERKYCELVCENDSLISHAIIIHVVCFKLGVNKVAIENNEEKNEQFDNKFVLLLFVFYRCTISIN